MSPSLSKAQNQQHPCLRAREDRCPHTGRDQIHPSSTCLFYSGPEQIEKAHHIREGNQFNLKLIEKLPYETSKMMFDQLGAISWPSQVDT